MKNPEPILAEHPFFFGMPYAYIQNIAWRSYIAQYKEGDMLFKEGEPADKFYLIIKGKVAVETFASGKGPVVIQTVEDGEMLGWSWLAAPFKYRFSARVLAPTAIIVLNGDELRRECELEPRMGFELMKRMVHALTLRLEQTRMMALDIYSNRSK